MVLVGRGAMTKRVAGVFYERISIALYDSFSILRTDHRFIVIIFIRVSLIGSFRRLIRLS